MEILDQILNTFLDALNLGFGRVSGDVKNLFNLLVIINVTMAAIFWAVAEDRVVVQFLQKVFYIGIFAWLVENWGMFADLLADSFLMLGVKAGGGEAGRELLRSPSAVAALGFQLTKPIAEWINILTDDGIVGNFFDIALLTVAGFAIIVSFFLIAMQLFFALLLFKLGALATFVLVPFALLNRTSFITERPFAWVVSAGVRLMLLTMVIGLAEGHFQQLQIQARDIDFDLATNAAGGAVVLFLLTLTASQLASDLVTGTARFGAGNMAAAGIGAAYVGRYVTAKTVAAGGAAASAAQRGYRAAAQLAPSKN